MLQFKINKDVKDENGWGLTTKTGIYGTDYLGARHRHRARCQPYPTSLKDGEGPKYNGENRYVMHFPEGRLPPAQGIWSLTMYDASYFFVNNPLNRYSISARQLQLYLPDESDPSIIDGSWKIPPVKKV